MRLQIALLALACLIASGCAFREDGDVIRVVGKVEGPVLCTQVFPYAVDQVGSIAAIGCDTIGSDRIVHHEFLRKTGGAWVVLGIPVFSKKLEGGEFTFAVQDSLGEVLGMYLNASDCKSGVCDIGIVSVSSLKSIR